MSSQKGNVVCWLHRFVFVLNHMATIRAWLMVYARERSRLTESKNGHSVNRLDKFSVQMDKAVSGSKFCLCPRLKTSPLVEDTTRQSEWLQRLSNQLSGCRVKGDAEIDLAA